MKKQLLRYALIHAAILGFLLSILGLRHMALACESILGFSLPVCLLHDLFFLYCPFCGGTRAVSDLLAGDLVSAFWANAAVVLSLPLLIWTDARALVLMIGKKPVSPLFPFSPWLFPILFGAFFVLRNALLLLGIDFLGDFTR